MDEIKVLLIGNVANNSYNNAKFLRRRGVEADVLCYNFTYVMSQPEWEDAEFDAEVDSYFPDWDSVDLHGFKRPQWFMQRVMAYPPKPKGICARAFYFVIRNFPRLPLPQFFTTFVKRMSQTLHNRYLRSTLPIIIPPVIKSYLRPIFYRIHNIEEQLMPSSKNRDNQITEETESTRMKLDVNNTDLVREFARHFPHREDKLTRADIRRYTESLPWFWHIFKNYNLIHGSATDAIYAMLTSPAIPYVAFEHGTLRELPLENSAQGRLMALAYKKAAKVIITNPDTVKTAKKLGLDNYIFVPHPLDQDKYQPIKTSLHRDLRQKHQVDHIIFCPTRHDWRIKGNDLIIRGLARFIKTAKKKVLVIFTHWGLEIERSEKLIRSLGVEKSVLWLPVLNEANHIRFLNAADLVVDQLILASFGGIAYKGMSCGKPVISSYLHEDNAWCLPEPPPLVTAYSEAELCQRIKELLVDDSLREHIGQQGREWILKHHTWQLVADQLINIYNQVLQNGDCR